MGIPLPGAASVRVVDSEVMRVAADAACHQHGNVEAVTTPAELVWLVDAGWIRDQPVARIALRPVVVDQDGTLGYVPAVTVRVDYGVRAGAPPSTVSPFDDLLRNALITGPVAAHPAALERHHEDLALGQLRDGGAGAGSEQAVTVTAASSPGQASGAASAAGDPRALKIGVSVDGPVVVSGAALEAAGWDLDGLDPRVLGLEAAGVGHAIALSGTEDGRFDSEDFLLFEGRAARGEYTRQNVYWLTASGGGPRFASRDGTPSPGSVAANVFTETVRFEQDSSLYHSMARSEGPDRWMWGDPMPAPTERAETLTVVNLAPTSHAATLRVAFQGYTDDPAVNPDHHVRIDLNGRQMADHRFDGLGVHIVEVVVPAGVLANGANQVTIHSVGDTGASVDSIMLNWIEIDVVLGYRATNDRLEFACPGVGTYAFHLRGFIGPDVVVSDVTNPVRPVTIGGAHREAVAGGALDVRFDSVCAPARASQRTPPTQRRIRARSSRTGHRTGEPTPPVPTTS